MKIRNINIYSGMPECSLKMVDSSFKSIGNSEFLKISLRIFISLGICLSISMSAHAGDINPPNAPDANSMFTIENVYQRLIDGAPGSQHSGFANPISGPGSTMHSINQIMEKLPAKDDTNGANPEHVMAGKTYWGLSGNWGKQTGTMVTQTLNAASANVPAGYYTATTLDAVDTDLVSANIKAGVTIFGVEGKTEVVDTSSGDAVAANVSIGKKAWVDGLEVTGRLAGGTYCDPAKTYSPGGRWCDNGNGTITDITTGLIWLKDWGNADTYYNKSESVSNLTIGGVSAGTWRLPTRQEFKNICKEGDERISIGSTYFFTNVPTTYEHDYGIYFDHDARLWCCGPVEVVPGFYPDAATWNLTDQRSDYLYTYKVPLDDSINSNIFHTYKAVGVAVMSPRPQ
jgi:hypothetical protein